MSSSSNSPISSAVDCRKSSSSSVHRSSTNFMELTNCDLFLRDTDSGEASASRFPSLRVPPLANSTRRS